MSLILKDIYGIIYVSNFYLNIQQCTALKIKEDKTMKFITGIGNKFKGIWNIVKEFFASLLGAPVTANNLTVGSLPPAQSIAKVKIPEVQKEEKGGITKVMEKIRNKIRTINWHSVLVHVCHIIRGIALVIVGAILYTALAHFVPELREKLPSFYYIIDHILYAFEWMVNWLLQSLHLM